MSERKPTTPQEAQALLGDYLPGLAMALGGALLGHPHGGPLAAEGCRRLSWVVSQRAQALVAPQEPQEPLEASPCPGWGLCPSVVPCDEPSPSCSHLARRREP